MYIHVHICLHRNVHPNFTHCGTHSAQRMNWKQAHVESEGKCVFTSVHVCVCVWGVCECVCVCVGG